MRNVLTVIGDVPPPKTASTSTGTIVILVVVGVAVVLVALGGWRAIRRRRGPTAPE